MTILMLLFIGSVYLINGMTLLGRIDAKSAAPLNLFIGAALVLVTIHLALGMGVFSPDAPSVEIIGAVGAPLFAFTFLYVGINNYTGHDGAGLGWYCGWSAMVSAGLSIAFFTLFQDTASGLLWAVWAVVFTSFFLTMIVGLEHLTAATGRFVVLAGFTTCVIPSVMMMLGLWSPQAGIPVYVMELGTIAYYVFGAMRASRTSIA
ncbi:MAG: AmiS/UreI family transporter [Pseudomonadota bacterium]